jgi:GNAT superfamily N-acetyltransferase
MTYTVYTLAEKPHLEPQIDALSRVAWPVFLRHSSNLYWHLLFETLAPYQLLLCEPEDHLIAVGHTAPLVWDGTAADLPATIDAIIARAERGQQNAEAPNTFSALAAMIVPEQRGRGLSQAVVLEMKALAQRHGCTALIAPVRPTWKDRYPLVALERYAAWRRPDGAPLDPWLRVHWRLGAEQLMIASNTLTVEGSVAEWEGWADMAFPETGVYVVPGALQPVVIDRERNVGRYEDPNVWMRHPVAPAA